MNTQLLINTIHRAASALITRPSVFTSGQCSFINRFSHVMTQSVYPNLSINLIRERDIQTGQLLKPSQHLLTQVCEMRTKGKIHRRCKDCFLYCSKGRWHIGCPTHPRHRVAQIVKKERNTWILTSVCQHPKRPW